MDKMPSWIWIAGGAVLLLLLFMRNSGGSTLAPAPADTASADAYNAAQLQARQGIAQTVLNIFGTLSLQTAQNQAQYRYAQLQDSYNKQIASINASEAEAIAQMQINAARAMQKSQAKSSFWNSLLNGIGQVAGAIWGNHNNTPMPGAYPTRPPTNASAVGGH